MKCFTWKKKKLVYDPTTSHYSYGMLPCVIHIDDDLFVVGFSCRNKKNQSHIFLSYANAYDGVFKIISEPKLALSPGPLGHFDSDGVLTSSFLSIGKNSYMYYGGWENMVSVPYTANTGRLIFDKDNLTLTREFLSPVLARNPQSPIFSGAPFFWKTKDEIWAWYTSALRWEKYNNEFKHYYTLRRAVSKDGINWISDDEVAINFLNDYEYAIARSSIIQIDDIFYIWFSCRSTKTTDTYRIGFAYSKDLLNWKRDDSLSGIDVSNEGWDSEMICYPHVFKHKDWLYMLYNGNGYGKTGFGCAVMKL